MNKLFCILICLVAAACGGPGAPKPPSADQVVSLVTTAITSVDDLVAKADEVVAAAKPLGEDSLKYAEAIAFARKLAESAVLVSEIGIKACLDLPNQEPYTKICDAIAVAHDKASNVLAALNVLGEKK